MSVHRFKTAILAASAGLALMAASAAHADEGMWTLDNLPVDAIQKTTGFRPDSDWVKKVQLSSVRLAGGCSGSFVSPNGLVMTNHHCAATCIAELSTPENDIQANGFLAKTTGEEKRCAGVEINQLVSITDVTDTVRKATEGKTGQAFADARRAALADVEKQCSAGDTGVRCDVVTLYQGGKYHLYKYKRYQDVRLAFAPEHSLGAFGGDPDNFNFPRYSLDMSLMRVYGADGKPISSPDFFKWSKDGTKAGDPVFVTGHPGSTSRLATIAQLKTVRDTALPSTLIYLSELRGRLIEFGRENPERASMALESLQGVENSFKVYKGRHQALTDAEFFGKKQAQEEELRQRISQDQKLRVLVGDAYEQIEAAQKRSVQLYPRYLMLERMRGFNSELAGFARQLVRATAEQTKPNAERLREYGEARLPALKQALANPAPVHTELDIATLAFSLSKLREQFGPDDALVKTVLGKKSPEELAVELVKGSKLGDPAVRLALFEGGAKAVQASTDPMIKLMAAIDTEARATRKAMEEEVEAVVEKAQARIAQARFAIYGDSIYPDATFSLRLSYGVVKGWEEIDGHQVQPFTTYAGLFERETGSDPFALPKRWLDAKSKIDLKTPYNTSTTNDIIGGNSGSPGINTKAEVVGLLFDGNIHSLSGDYGYEPKRNRAVMVDVRGMREALDKVYGADNLLKELGF